MHLHFERNDNAKCDCAILSMSWMGKVPDELPEDEGWKLNRTNYYQEGWLATGNVRGIVGVTFTTSHCKKIVDYPLRTNYNLRGHRSEVMLVKWNEPYQKLMSCDSTGIIFVWIKYEGRWSIELINDRNTPVTHFAWSHDGRMALICYQDGFVLVGSVAGQRYWSSMLNLDATITCGVWTPDDQQVYFATTLGQIVVMDVHGAMVSQVQLSSEVGITAMAWSCEKFKMEEGDDLDNCSHTDRPSVLAVTLDNGYIFLLKAHDDLAPAQVHTGLAGPLSMEWSNSRELLAVAGSTHGSGVDGADYVNKLLFYTEQGVLLYSTLIPATQCGVTALTWGHNDRRLLVATGCVIHIAWVAARRVASLQLLARLSVYERLRSEAQVTQLPLPTRVHSLIANLFRQTIRCCVESGRGFVSRPPGGARLHCTMIRHDEDSAGAVCYTLYLEYLGGLVALLKGKRRSKLRPEFIIYDPTSDTAGQVVTDSTDSGKSSGSSATCATESDSDHSDEGCASPKLQRRRRRRRKPVPHDDDLTYIDTLPEQARLVEVTSNIWGTKFKIHGLADCVPANLGHVTYKTSLLHLQPRQMTLAMTELRDDLPTRPPDPSFNPHMFSEDEDEVVAVPLSPVIAPLTPRLSVDRRHKADEHQFPARTVIGVPELARGPPGASRPAPDASRSPGIGPQGKRQSLIGCDDSEAGIGLMDINLNIQPSSSMKHGPEEQCAMLDKGLRRERSVRDEERKRKDATDVKATRDRLNLNLVDAGMAAMKIRGKSSPSGNQVGIAVSRCKPTPEEMLFIDEEEDRKMLSPCVADSMVRSCSVGYLDLVDTHMVPCEVALSLLRKESPKRLVLVPRKRAPRRPRKEPPRGPRLKHCRKSKSLDSGDLFPATTPDFKPLPSLPDVPVPAPIVEAPVKVPKPGLFSRRPKKPEPELTPKTKRRGLAAHLELLTLRSRSRSEDTRSLPPSSPLPQPRATPVPAPRSQPNSPQMGKKLKQDPLRKRLLNSPLLRRKRSNKTESSDDEVPILQPDEFQNLETFQKSQLRQKLRRGRDDTMGSGRREFVMHNKAPMWNENSQVYQLDFGGRVTQESAKNFQIEFRGKQVMQFGRIDGNAYTLDFQYPFSALQAFAVALANVTQRLK